jgi:predicted aldo/keto reductase-like oxidoreductase
MGQDGVLQTCKEARKEGLIDFIGITSHKPRVLMKAIETGEFDTVLVPLNVVTRQALEELIPYAKEQDIGVVTMKPFSAKTSRLITCLYNPSLSLLSDEPELHTLLGADANEMARNSLRFVLAQEIAVTIPGVKSAEEAETAAKAGNGFVQLTQDEKNHFHVKHTFDECRDCGSCLPCPEGIDIAAALRFQTLADTYGLKNWVRKLYNGLENKADKCTKCGFCSSKCPYKLQIIDKLKETHKNLSN